MNAYYIQDRLEAQSWARHYQQIAREEKEAELADDMEKGLPQHLFESLCIDHLQRHGASKKAITRAFDDDVEFQERMAEHIRYMVETIAHHQRFLLRLMQSSFFNLMLQPAKKTDYVGFLSHRSRTH